MPHTLLKNFYVAEQGQEKSSDFLNNLYLQIQERQQVGAVSKKDVCSELVQQFLSGCSDETLLLKLRNGEKDPPEYSTLLASIRLKEAKCTCHTLIKRMAKSRPVQAEEQIQQLKQWPILSHSRQSHLKGGTLSKKWRNFEWNLQG